MLRVLPPTVPVLLLQVPVLPLISAATFTAVLQGIMACRAPDQAVLRGRAAVRHLHGSFLAAARVRLQRSRGRACRLPMPKQASLPEGSYTVRKVHLLRLSTVGSSACSCAAVSW